MDPKKIQRGVWGAEPPSETVSNVHDYEPTEESQSRKKMDRKEEKEMMMQCNCSKGSWRGLGRGGAKPPPPVESVSNVQAR